LLVFNRKYVFVCFVLEHLRRSDEAIASLLRVLRPVGTLTVIEGDHGSAYFHPPIPIRTALIRSCTVSRARCVI